MVSASFFSRKKQEVLEKYLDIQLFIQAFTFDTVKCVQNKIFRRKMLCIKCFSSLFSSGTNCNVGITKKTLFNIYFTVLANGYWCLQKTEAMQQSIFNWNSWNFELLIWSFAISLILSHLKIDFKPANVWQLLGKKLNITIGVGSGDVKYLILK